jgi:hypothetical protein
MCQRCNPCSLGTQWWLALDRYSLHRHCTCHLIPGSRPSDRNHLKYNFYRPQLCKSEEDRIGIFHPSTRIISLGRICPECKRNLWHQGRSTQHISNTYMWSLISQWLGHTLCQCKSCQLNPEWNRHHMSRRFHLSSGSTKAHIYQKHTIYSLDQDVYNPSTSSMCHRTVGFLFSHYMGLKCRYDPVHQRERMAYSSSMCHQTLRSRFQLHRCQKCMSSEFHQHAWMAYRLNIFHRPWESMMASCTHQWYMISKLRQDMCMAHRSCMFRQSQGQNLGWCTHLKYILSEQSQHGWTQHKLGKFHPSAESTLAFHIGQQYIPSRHRQHKYIRRTFHKFHPFLLFVFWLCRLGRHRLSNRYLELEILGSPRMFHRSFKSG